jgi:hypothetical protein
MIYEIRAWLCEVFIGWAGWIAPKGYVPSYVQVSVEFYERGRRAVR